MSADNGIYVLYTESEKGPEYRVAYAQAIDSAYGTFNDEAGIWEGDNTFLASIFSESTVFYTLNEALDFAEELEHNYEYLEDGICVISDFKDRGFLFQNG